MIAAYVYPGWHRCPERDRGFPPRWSEWDLVLRALPRFPGHEQPRLPLHGAYDDSLPHTAEQQVSLARSFGIDLFVYGFFWSRGKRVFERALDHGFLGAACNSFPFAVMWANRMPRRVLPVKRTRGAEIDSSRLVYTDPEDFLALLRFLAEHYFVRPGYFRLQGRFLFSIFDSTFFVRQMGAATAREAIRAAREYLSGQGLPDLHLMAVNPAPFLVPSLAAIGFDSATHYVHLPQWKGPYLQDYRTLTALRRSEWEGFFRAARLPYFPSVSPGWDATPRGALHGGRRIMRYPWWPVVVGGRPELFRDFLEAAVRFSSAAHASNLTFVASWNEWSEGHYLEPDQRFGTGWLEAVLDAKSAAS
ncbi:MAG: glycoside hydrolase family 99-like domain-containing protein [bacterium]